MYSIIIIIYSLNSQFDFCDWSSCKQVYTYLHYRYAYLYLLYYYLLLFKVMLIWSTSDSSDCKFMFVENINRIHDTGGQVINERPVTVNNHLR